MAISNNRNKLKDINNSGFGANSSQEGTRLLNRDGTTNLKKTGMPFYERISLYHTLLRMDRSMFLLTIFIFYTITNLFFAVIYFITGVEHLSGTNKVDTIFERFLEAFFFSSQTLTTVGYGHIAPDGWLTNFIASTESLIGILSFAVVTGLIYGRFSKPKAYILFSDDLLIAPYKSGKALMFRMATYKNNHLTDVETQVTLALHMDDEGNRVTKFYNLPLELSKINSLASSWTVVHNITEESPLYSLTKQQLSDSRMELMVYVKAFDDHFSNTVQQRTSYIYRQLRYGAKFLPMFERAPDGQYTILYLDRISAHEPAEIHEFVSGV